MFKFAGAFVAFMIGSGFASGMEILQFFTCFGYRGVLAALISMVFFIWTGSALMKRGFDTRKRLDLHPFDYWLIDRQNCGWISAVGKILSLSFEWLNPLFLFSMMVIMVSGSGAVIHQYFHLPVKTGCLIMCILILFSVFFGLRRLIDIIGALGPFTILFTVGIALFALFQNPQGLLHAEHSISDASLPKAVGAWWFAGIPYTAYNIMPAVPFLTSMGAEAGSRREAALGAILGSIMMMVSAILLSLAQMAYLPELSGLKIPNLFLAGLLPDVFTLLFVLILLGEIFSSAAPMLWITCNQFIRDGNPSNKLLAILLTAIAYRCGQIPFDKLVGTIYPLMGYIGILLLVCIPVRSFIKK